MAVAAVLSSKNCLNLGRASEGLVEVVEAKLEKRRLFDDGGGLFDHLGGRGADDGDAHFGDAGAEDLEGGGGYVRCHGRNRVSYRAVGLDANFFGKFHGFRVAFRVWRAGYLRWQRLGWTWRRGLRMWTAASRCWCECRRKMDWIEEMMNWLESAEAIGQVDELLASVGLGHGRRETRAGTWAGRRAKRKERPAQGEGGGRQRGRARPGWCGLRGGRSMRGCGMGSVRGRVGFRRFTTMESGGR